VEKKFKLAADEIRDLATGFGGCIATDKIMVDGERVRFMYRQEPDNDVDSGWRGRNRMRTWTIPEITARMT
jgi:hypothetical protein